jgi:hypothetical protein
MNYSNCPLCGQPIFRQDYHRCHGIGAIPAESFTISAPDGLQYCQGCGAPMLQPEHTCRKVEPITQDALKPKQRDDITPAMAERMDIMREDARIEAEAEYKQAMNQCLKHLKTCTTCFYLSQVDGNVCSDMVKLRALRDDKFTQKAKVK